eukprot:6162653-Prymnesium_polylepis.1
MVHRQVISIARGEWEPALNASGDAAVVRLLCGLCTELIGRNTAPDRVFDRRLYREGDIQQPWLCRSVRRRAHIDGQLLFVWCRTFAQARGGENKSHKHLGAAAADRVRISRTGNSRKLQPARPIACECAGDVEKATRVHRLAQCNEHSGRHDCDVRHPDG